MAWWRAECVHIIENERYGAILSAICKSAISITMILLPLVVTDDTPQIRSLENQFLAVDPRRLPEIDTRIVEMMGYRIHQPFVGYGMSPCAVGISMPSSEPDTTNTTVADGLSPLRGARRMVEWLQKPLDENPPTFPDHGTGKSKL